MKKIIFPTDLTSNSINALNYAQYIAIQSGLELLLFHSSMSEQDKEQADAKLNKITEELRLSEKNSANPTSYSSVCVEGMPVAEVADWMSKPEAELLVMATSGDHRDHFQGIYLKSNTASLLEKIQKPVLFFPLHTKTDKISNVLVSIDVLKYSLKALSALAKFVNNFNSKIKFVYVTNGAMPEVTKAIAQFNEFLLNEFTGAQLEVVANDREGYDKSISAIIEEEKSDLLVMFKYKQQFWEKWFVKSDTQEMTYSSAIPVLVLSAE